MRSIHGIVIGFFLGLMVAGGCLRPLQAQGAVATTPRMLLEVRTSVSPANYTDKCPAKLTFTATIITAAVPRGPVIYQWVRSDRVVGPRRRLKMTSTTAALTSVWPVGASGQMMRPWVQLKILSPVAVTSNQAVAAVLCH